MERLIKRSTQAAKTAERRIAKRWKAVKKSQEWMARREQTQYKSAMSQVIVSERKRRQEQWAQGPLAPRYDVGDQASSWGTVPLSLMNIPQAPKSWRPDWFHIKATDRVAIMAGKGKGMVTTVRSVDTDSCTLTVDGLSQDFKVPEHARAAFSTREIEPRPLSIPWQNVKLVWPLPDEKTGAPVDVIIDKMEPVGREWDKHKRELSKGQRLISGTTIIIPWPEEVDQDYDTYPVDTTVELVDAVTSRPMLLRAPMPLSVIDELRGKFSRYRKRFDWDTKDKIISRANKVEHRKDLIKTMRTPLQELAELRAQQRAARERDLTTDQLARIGAIMAQELQSGTATALRK